MRTLGPPSGRTALIGLWCAPLLGVVLAMLLVWQTSYAAFVATTSNGPNNWAAGTVAIGDNDLGVAMFSATPKLKPGSTGSRCIVVTSTGTVSSTVKLYGSGLATTNGLSSHLDLVITRGTGSAADCSNFSGSANVYTGTLAAFTAQTWDSGHGNWAPTGAASESATYRFDYTLNTGAPQTTQGGTAQVTFVWEARS